jgi:hypothetical protein
MERQNLKIIHDRSLVNLDLSGMGLKSIPKEVFNLPNLKTLDLSANRFSKFPHELFQIKTLQHLDLSRNRISHFQNQENLVSGLRTLSLAFNQIETFEGFEGLFPELQRLDLRKNKLQILPDQVFNGMILLRILDLSFNRLSSLPKSIEKVSLLKDLNLQRNKFVNLPLHLSKLQFLETLNFSVNPLGSFCIPSGCLPYLKNLSLNNTALGALPKEVFLLERIEQIDLRGIDFDPYVLLDASSSLKKIRSSKATASFIAFSKRCNQHDIDSTLRQELYTIKILKKRSTLISPTIREALDLLDVNFEQKVLYQQKVHVSKDISPNLSTRQKYFMHKSCGLPLYLIQTWGSVHNLNFVDKIEEADIVVFGRGGARFMIEKNHISLNTFLRWISGIFSLSNQKRIYIESLIGASSNEFRQLGMKIILNKGWIERFEDELKAEMKKPESVVDRVMRHLISHLN